MDGNWFRDIIILSIDAIENPTAMDSYRRICRWYSKTFSTPLSEVEGLDPEYVARAYWEEQVGELADRKSSGEEKAEEDYEEFVAKILKDSNDLVKEADEDDEFFDQLQKQVEKEKAEAEKKANKNSKSEEKLAKDKEPNLIDTEESISIPSEDSIEFEDSEE